MISAKTETNLLDALNEVIAMEYGAVIQYAQHSFSVSGQDRMQYAPFFDANSKEAHLHALNLGNKIVEVSGKNKPDTRYFRFVSATEAYYSGDKNDITKPVHLK